jgi:hypothetical protein
MIVTQMFVLISVKNIIRPYTSPTYQEPIGATVYTTQSWFFTNFFPVLFYVLYIWLSRFQGFKESQ